MKTVLVLLFILAGCNSEQASMTAMQGIRDPSDPLPVIVNVNPPPDEIYTMGNTLYFSVDFNEEVEVAGIPKLPFMADSGLLEAQYISGSGSNRLLFSITLTQGNDADGIQLNGFIDNSFGSIRSRVDGEYAVLTYLPLSTPGIHINATPPQIIAVVQGANGVYKLNQAMDFYVRYSGAVMADEPAVNRLRLYIAGSTYFADYVSGSGTANHLYRYTVDTAMTDLDGVEIISGNIFTSSTFEDAFGNSVGTTFTAPGIFAQVQVDSESAQIVDVIEPANGFYYTNKEVTFLITTNEPVTVTGLPRLHVKLSDSNNTQYANYKAAGSTSTMLAFSYVVQVGDLDVVNGIDITPNTLDLNGGDIKDLYGNDLDLITGFVVGNLSNVKVDGIVPTVTTIPTSTVWQILGATFTIAVNWSEPVYVTGSPRLAMTIGSMTKFATYLSTAGSISTFTYTVVASDMDANGIDFIGIDLNGGTIRDGISTLSNNANTIFFRSGNTLIDGIPPTITSIVSGQTAYKEGQNLSLTVTFSEPVSGAISGTKLDLKSGTSTFFVTHISNTSTTVTYRRTVDGTEPLTYTGLEWNNLNLVNGASLQDVAGNALIPTLQPIPKIYLVHSAVQDWFDPDNVASASYFGVTLGTLKSIINPVSVATKTGNTAKILGATGAKELQFGNANTISFVSNNAEIVIVVYAYRGDLAGTQYIFSEATLGNYLKFSTSSNRITILSSYFDGTNFQLPDPIGNYTLASPALGHYRMSAIKFPVPPTTTSIKISDLTNQFKGSVAEIMVISDEQALIEIKAYLNNKYKAPNARNALWN